ncbi:MAG: hypothetical protein M9905_06105 [Rhizobiaceae bacterium]|nr:hypothetical protein [Rhizobiaceae bacterium]
MIATIDAADDAAPGFPRRTGVSDTFAYIAHFLPVAAITAVVELVFPLVLWAYTYWALAWDVFVRERRRERMRRDLLPKRPARAMAAPAMIALAMRGRFTPNRMAALLKTIICIGLFLPITSMTMSTPRIG